MSSINQFTSTTTGKLFKLDIMQVLAKQERKEILKKMRIKIPVTEIIWIT